MSTFTTTPSTICKRCSQPLFPGALACSNCQALVYAEDMERVAAQARSLEGESRLMEARDRWLSILPLLPPDSQQAVWIRGHARELEVAAPAAHRAGAPGSSSTWAKRLAPLGPLALIAAKFKSVLLVVFKLKFLLSFASFIAVYWSIWGARFGIGFAVLVLVHEMGHYIDIKRRGLPADMPVFLPGLGAYVRWNALGVSPETRAAISLAGPFAGLLAAAVCALVWRETGDRLWMALARVSAWFNVLNLTPIWIFDGAQAARALGRTERALLLVVSAGLGYATHEGVFYIVGAGTLFSLMAMLFARKAQSAGTIRLGLNQAVPATGAAPAAPEIVPARHDSHFIAAYFLAVLTGLAMVMWLLPGAGSGLP